MKVYQHILIILAIASTIFSGYAHYVEGQEYTWHIIALLWILSSYTGSIYNAVLEKKLRKYEN